MLSYPTLKVNKFQKIAILLYISTTHQCYFYLLQCVKFNHEVTVLCKISKAILLSCFEAFEILYEKGFNFS